MKRGPSAIPLSLLRPRPASEKEVETMCDHMMAQLGFEAVRFSTRRPKALKGAKYHSTRQTPGIPDRRYYHRELRIAVWVEVKRERGPRGGLRGARQSEEQKNFQAMVEAVGEYYLLVDSVDVLAAWVKAALSVARRSPQEPRSPLGVASGIPAP